ncbi:MAG: DEAD/DEAH box helicase [Opitutales bacterium]|nr:DEAD/DEAH box helicase [Opitutales bacterium]
MRGRRIYNPQALEAWFDRLPEDWEPLFKPEELEGGRSVYRQGVVGDVELCGDDAIVHFRMERREEYYVVVALDKNELTFRSSTDDIAFSRKLYAAAMYEIEELVVDEIPDLPPEKQQPQPEDSEDEADEEGGERNQEPPEEFRKIRIEVSLKDKELWLLPYWAGSEHAGISVFSGDTDERVSPRNDQEREQMIRLTSLALKAGFHFSKKRKAFSLTEAGRMILFATEDKGRWEHHFELKFHESAIALQKGTQYLEIGGSARESERRSGLKIDWNIRVGQAKLDRKSIKQLSHKRAGVHILPGVGAVDVSDGQLESLQLWGAPGAKNGGGQDIPKYMLFSIFGIKPVSLKMDSELHDWMEQIRHADGDELVLPKFLRQYQKSGVTWLHTLTQHDCHPLLADDMGLGKTVQVLSLLRKAERDDDLPDIIVCPASVVPVWQYEIRRWYPELKTAVLGKAGFTESARSQPDIWLSSYSQLRRQRINLAKAEFRYAVLDEAQYIKNPDAKVSQACYQLNARHRVAMTGTPIENRTEDIWALFRFLMPGILGTRRDFYKRLEGEERFEYLDRLRRQLQPFILRRTRDRVAPDLPPKLETSLVCPLTEVQRRHYQLIVRAAEEAIGNEWDGVNSKALHFFSVLTRLRQVCCDPGLLPDQNFNLENSGKIDALVRRLEESAALGGKVVVFSQFVSLLNNVQGALKQEVPQLKIFSLTGQTADRAKPVKGFQEYEGAAVILVSLKAGGTGITLHAADTVYLLDPWWNPAVEAQAVDRVHRIGQDKPVFVYRMITEGTVEAKIEQLKQEKRALFDEVIDSEASTAYWRSAFKDLDALISLSEKVE